MAKAEKVLTKLRRKPPDMELSDLIPLFHDLGWDFPDNGQSHQVIRTRQGFPITIAIKQGRRVKSAYLEMIRKRIEEEEGV